MHEAGSQIGMPIPEAFAPQLSRLFTRQTRLAQACANLYVNQWLSETAINKELFELQFLTSEEYKPWWLNLNPSTVFLDTEGMFDHEFDSQRFGLAVTMDQDTKIWKPDEAPLLINHLLSFNQIVCYGTQFDAYVLTQTADDRNKIQGLYNRMFDLAECIRIYKDLPRPLSLNKAAKQILQQVKYNLKPYAISGAHDIPIKLRDGTPKQKQAIADYCQQDTWLTTQLYFRFTDQDIFQYKIAVFQNQLERTALRLDQLDRNTGAILEQESSLYPSAESVLQSIIGSTFFALVDPIEPVQEDTFE